MKIYCNVIRLILIFSVFAACHQPKNTQQKIERSLYYWKSVFNPNSFEKENSTRLGIETVYLKICDIDWDEETKQPLPKAITRVRDSGFLKKLNVVPVIFITNECIFKLDSISADKLPAKIHLLVQKIFELNHLPAANEVQFDCDWTVQTRGTYFSMLKKYAQIDPAIKLSATIRLHQVKFSGKTGVPPVQRGMLMCYNMGNLKDPKTGNSILETAELKKYIGNLDKYPLQLDLALPLFSWNVLFRNGSYAGIVKDIDPDSIPGISVTGNRYRITEDLTAAGYTFKKGDVLRKEQSAYATIIEAENLLKPAFKNKDFRIALYHLDSLTLSKYSNHEMENIFDGMR